MAERFGVEGYPLLLMFRHGRHYNYTGPRHEEGVCPCYMCMITVCVCACMCGCACEHGMCAGKLHSFKNTVWLVGKQFFVKSLRGPQNFGF